MDRNIGAPNRRIPPDVQPKGSTSRDLNREAETEQRDDVPAARDADIADPD
jgi:hypothetical protein